MRILQLAAMVAFIWFAIHGPTAAVVVSGTVGAVLFIRDAIANRTQLKDCWPIIAGPVLGLIVCWGTGWFLVKLIGSSETVYVGPGFDGWNLPGTILGAAIWIGAEVWSARRWKLRQKNSATQL
jgi:hypothetical protein